MELKTEVKFKNGVNSPEESYWLGFLVGDGTIYENRYRLKLSLGRKDKKHVERFAMFLGHSKNRVCLYGSMAEFRVDNKQLLNNLYNLGLCANKVHKTHRGLIPKKYKRDFIRGLFDADGTIHFRKNKKIKTPDFHIYGTKDLLEGVGDIFLKDMKLQRCISTSKGQPRVLEYGGRWIVEKIGHYLFDKATICLERKYRMFQNIFEYNKNHERQWKKFSRKVIYEIRDLYKRGSITQLKIAGKFKISQPFVSRIINNKRYKDYIQRLKYQQPINF